MAMSALQGILGGSGGVQQLFKFSYRDEIDTKKVLQRVWKMNKIALKEGAREVAGEARKLLGTRGRAVGTDPRSIWSKGSSRAFSSQPGSPPFEYSSRLRRVIRYNVRKTTAIIGATATGEDHVGAWMTWGTKDRFGSNVPKWRGKIEPRPFMQPALANVLDRLPGKWHNRL
jgi:hypothetical protein